MPLPETTTEPVVDNALKDRVSKSFANWGYPSPYEDQSVGAGLGRGLAHLTDFPDWWHNVMSKGPVAGAGLGAAVAAPVGWAASHAINFFRDKDRQVSPTKLTALAAILGAAAGGFQGYVHKRAGFADTSSILGAIQSANLDPGMKMQMMSMLPSLSSNELYSLQRLIGGVGGAALGALLARFFFGIGLGSTSIGAALGGFLGFNAPAKERTSIYGN